MLFNAIKAALRFFFQLLLGFYRLVISPALHLISGSGSGCRFTPTCSEYASEAVKIHGPIRGGFFAIKRICRCHPFSRSGYDPVRAMND